MNMKRIIFTLSMLVVAIGLMAQEHLSFKGIPIEGSMTEFCKKLEAKGFTSLGAENNIEMFTGDFTGREASVAVASTDDGNDVFSVIVFFEPSDEWNSLVSTYNYYKDLYIRKYGKPAKSKERNPAFDDSNTILMGELYQGTVVWVSTWKATGGDIELSIEKGDAMLSGMVMIRYRDAQNVEAKIQKDLEDI